VEEEGLLTANTWNGPVVDLEERVQVINEIHNAGYTATDTGYQKSDFVRRTY
jgi:hypothetical protein